MATITVEDTPKTLTLQLKLWSQTVFQNLDCLVCIVFVVIVIILQFDEFFFFFCFGGCSDVNDPHTLMDLYVSTSDP